MLIKIATAIFEKKKIYLNKYLTIINFYKQHITRIFHCCITKATNLQLLSNHLYNMNKIWPWSHLISNNT